jgi:proline racemase
LTNVPSIFLGDCEVTTGSFGKVELSLAFGGNIYAYANCDEIGLKVRPENIKELLKAGRELLDELKGLKIAHPALPSIRGVLGVSLYQDLGRTKARNIMIARDDLFDRSPCGTGTCGRLAIKYVKENFGSEEFESRSIIDSVFFARIAESVTIRGMPAIVPEIRGSAFITGRTDVVVSDSDPLAHGFLVA